MEQWKREYVGRLANRIRKMRMETPVLLMLEAHRPLARLGGHLLAVTEPVAAGLVGLERIRRLREILWDAEAVDLLANLLEGKRDDPATTG